MPGSATATRQLRQMEIEVARQQMRHTVPDRFDRSSLKQRKAVGLQHRVRVRGGCKASELSIILDRRGRQRRFGQFGTRSNTIRRAWAEQSQPVGMSD